MDKNIEMYGADTIDNLEWPETEQAQYAKKFLLPIIKEGISKYILNANTNLKVLKVGDFVLPITVTDRIIDQNCYACSPYSQYVSYALECISLIKSRWLKLPCRSLIHLLGCAFKMGKIDRVVIVNNWLFSTNLHPEIPEKQIAAIKNFLKIQFPSHAIIFRSVHSYQNSQLSEALGRSSFHLIASRQVFFLDARNEKIFSSRIFKSDMKLLKESEYTILQHNEIPHGAAAKISELYTGIYLEKHSKLNPQWTERFMDLVIKQKLLELKILIKGDSIHAVAGYFSCGDIMTSPLFGYDVKASPDEKLYRLTSTVLTCAAKDRKMVFHLSSGASFFKKIRKAEGHVEYMAVCHEHLPLYRRLPWRFLQLVSNTVGVSFMRYYDK